MTTSDISDVFQMVIIDRLKNHSINKACNKADSCRTFPIYPLRGSSENFAALKVFYSVCIHTATRSSQMIETSLKSHCIFFYFLFCFLLTVSLNHHQLAWLCHQEIVQYWSKQLAIEWTWGYGWCLSSTYIE